MFFITIQEIAKLSQHNVTLFSIKRTRVLAPEVHGPEFSRHAVFSLVRMFHGNISAEVCVLIVKQVVKPEFLTIDRYFKNNNPRLHHLHPWTARIDPVLPNPDEQHPAKI